MDCLNCGRSIKDMKRNAFNMGYCDPCRKVYHDGFSSGALSASRTISGILADELGKIEKKHR